MIFTPGMKVTYKDGLFLAGEIYIVDRQEGDRIWFTKGTWDYSERLVPIQPESQWINQPKSI